MGNEGVAQALGFVAELKDKIHVASEVEIDGRKYSRGSLQPIYEPSVPKIELHTLTGLADYCAANVDGLDLDKCMIHVVGPVEVRLLTAAFGPFKQRTTVVKSEPILPAFPFGRFISNEEFIIGVNAAFVDSADKDDVLKAVAAIKINAGGAVEDNGTSQTVTVEAGARLMGKKDIKPRVHLHPYSTFQDIEQPRREFILRLNSEGQPGLFVADGEAWRNKAMADIKKWLGEKMPSMQIIA